MRKILCTLLLTTAVLASTNILAADFLLMTCAQHGPGAMNLKFVRTAGTVQSVEIVATDNGQKWTVRINGTAVTTADQTTAHPGIVSVHPGDTVTIRVGDAGIFDHGAVFKSEAIARDFLTINDSAGQALGPQAVGDFLWGTGVFGSNTTLVVATVRAATSPDTSRSSLLRRLNMSEAMVVPSCTGGNFLIAPSLGNEGQLIAIPLLDASAEDADTSMTTIRSFDTPNLRWEKSAEQIEVGKELQWMNGKGTHGLRITNWTEVKDSIDVGEVLGSHEDFVRDGKNSQPSSAAGTLFARLKVKSVPSATDTIKYNCIIHGNAMTGTVKILPAAAPPANKSHSAER